MKNCPVCGIPPIDGCDNQVVLWGFGIHDAETNSRKSVNKPMSELVLLHKECLLTYIEGEFLDSRVNAKISRR